MNVYINPYEVITFGDHVYFNGNPAILQDYTSSGIHITSGKCHPVYGQYFALCMNNWVIVFPVVYITNIYIDPTKQDPNINNSRPIYSISWENYEYPNKPE